MTYLTEAEYAFVQELKRRVGNREHLPNYEFNPHHKNWVLSVQKEYALSRQGNVRRNKHLRTELRVASPKAMMSIIDAIVDQHRAAVKEYEARCRAEPHSVAAQRDSCARSLQLLRGVETSLYHKVSGVWEEFVDKINDTGLEFPAGTFELRNELVEAFVPLVQEDFEIVEWPEEEWPDDKFQLEREGLLFSVALHWYNMIMIDVTPKNKPPETPERPTLDAESFKVDLEHPDVKVLEFEYDDHLRSVWEDETPRPILD